MAKIQRYNGNLKAFGADAAGTERSIFGDGTGMQSDDLTDNINTALLRGWGSLPLGEKPPREWFNSAHWVATQLSAYLHQMGVAEYDAAQEYHKGSVVQRSGSIMVSSADDNTDDTFAWYMLGSTHVPTFSQLEAESPTYSDQSFVCRERDDAVYIVQDAGYTAQTGDVTFANGRVGALQFNPARIKARQFGGAWDGSEDNAPLLGAILNRCTKGGKVLVDKIINIETDLTIPSGRNIEGSHQWPFVFDGTDLLTYENRMVINPSATIRMLDDTSVTRLVVLRKGLTAPANAASVATWSGTAFSPIDLFNGARLSNCFIGGFEYALNTGTQNTPKLTLDRLFLDNLNGIRIENARDICYLDRIHAWPAMSVALPGRVDADLERSGTAFYFNTTDWCNVTNCFSYGYNEGFTVENANSVSLINCGADNAPTNTLASKGFSILGTSAETTLVSCRGAAHGADGLYINVTGATTNVTVTASKFWSSVGNQINVVAGRVFIGGGTRVRGETSGEVGVKVTSNDEVYLDNVVFESCSLGIDAAADRKVIENNPVFTNCPTRRNDKTLLEITSAGSFNLVTPFNVFKITGSVDIGTIGQVLEYKGEEITLFFDSALNILTVGNINTAGGGNIAVTPGSTVKLFSDGVEWYESGRSII